jgi:OOP family OmpA-OmpF porin
MKHFIYLGMSLAFVHAAAAQEENRGAYMGFSVGSFSYEEEDEELGLAIDDTSTGYRLMGGYRFSDNFAVEGGWGKTGDIQDSYTQSIPPFGDFTLDISGEYEVMTVRALGIIPFEKVSLLGGVGFYDADLDLTVGISGFGDASATDSDSGATLVGGFEFNLERVDIRTELEWFDVDDGAEAFDLSVGVLFNF